MAACVAATLFAGPALAAETFAQVSQINQTDTLQFINNGNGTGSLQSYAGSVVNFGFPTTLNPLLELQDALFNLSATINAQATVVAGTTIVQPIASGTFSFTRTSPFAGLSNLLTVTFTNAVLTGLVNGTSPTFLASQPGGVSTVSFTSDFLDFTNSTDRAFSFSLSGVNPRLALDGGNVIQSFSGDTTATFSVDVARPTGGVPEPASWALLILGFGGAGALIRAKRRMALA